MGTDHDTLSTDALFAPLQEAALAAYVRTLAKGKAPRSPRALIHLAWLALLVWLGLGHLVTAAHRAAAVAAACPPGRKPKDDPQTSLLDVVTWSEDERPGVFVSLVRLRIGNVRETCGQFALNLQGCHVPATAAAAAVAAGWAVLPETRGNSEGLRFLPPSVVALYLAGNAASLARELHPEEDPHTQAIDGYRDALAWILRGGKDTRGYRDPRSIAADLLGVNEEDFVEQGLDPLDASTRNFDAEDPPRELTGHDGYTTDDHVVNDLTNHNLMTKIDVTPKDWNRCPSCAELTDLPGGEINQPGERFLCVHCGKYIVADYVVDKHGNGEWILVTAKQHDGIDDEPPASHDDAAWQAEQDAHEARFEPTFEDAAAMSGTLTQADEDQPRHPDIAPPYPVPDLTIGDAVHFTSGPHTGRIAHVFEVSADKPKAQLVGRKVEIVGAIEVPGDAVEVSGDDPDEPSLRPSVLTKRTKKPSDKRKLSGVEGKAKSKDGKRRST